MDLLNVIDLNLNEMARALASNRLTREQELYCALQSAFQKSSLSELEDLANSHKMRGSNLEAFAQALVTIASGKNSTNLQQLIQQPGPSDAFEGEKLFVLGIHLADLGSFQRAEEYFKRSSHLLSMNRSAKRISALAKSIRCQILSGQIKNALARYNSLFLEAIQSGNCTTAGEVLSQLAHEMHRLGANRNALQMHNKAIVLLGTESSGDKMLHATTLRCLTLFALKKDLAFNHELTKLLQFSSQNAKEILKWLEHLKKPVETATAFSSKYWQHLLEEALQLQKLNAISPLTKLEEKLLVHIYEKPRKKVEAITHLYGNQLPESCANNRFHNLLNRLRKKRQGEIVFTEGQYRTNSESA